ncbi:MAG: cell division protein FtsH [Candidatus Fischerbacteria bacterium RBG_13_37_8]|uniref:ATP-dependent zinc metalloprotease FtsH n=1 Tax=Candidatus Fischerbacteria bacterium RBG_13_37_8 TaxID=1817863 RepID=A0A1F5V6S6_9BACT|nr:MAG: cell division protein FtsH [Candidatus Fischerbacteria bacterium RBG_13_37_8]
MEPKTKYLFIIILAAFLLAFFLHKMSAKSKEIPYSEFRAMVSKGEVTECTVGQRVIEGKAVVKGEEKEFVTLRVEEDKELVDLLEKHKVKYTGTEDQSWFYQLFLTLIIPLILIILIWNFIFKRMAGAGDQVMSFGRNKAKLYASVGEKITFKDVAGIEDAQMEMMEMVEFLKNPQKFQRLGGKIPKGVLLVGPPGTGKTLLAKATAGEAGVPFFSMNGSEFVEMFVGVGAARVRDLFDQALKKAPCIIFIDEIDAIGRHRGAGSIVGGNDEREQTLNQLLSEMDGFSSKKGVIIMAATNRPDVLDSALLRPGRFDRQIVLHAPDLAGREAILNVHIRSLTLSPEVDLHSVAARTPGFVGADLSFICNEAALLAARNDKDAIEMSDFDKAIDRVIAGPEKTNRLISQKEKEIVAFHEAGHTIVAHFLPRTDPVTRVSIIPRGIHALGVTMQTPIEDRYLMTKSELEEKLCTLLGGRSAEELIFNEISTGAQNDLRNATELARSMIAEYGMNKKIGLISFPNAAPMFLRRGFYDGQGAYSEQTSYEIEEEVKAVLSELYDKATTILKEHEEMLDILANALLQKETIEKKELIELLGPKKVLEKRNREQGTVNSGQ